MEESRHHSIHFYGMDCIRQPLRGTTGIISAEQGTTESKEKP
jgi:hypothetical protein